MNTYIYNYKETMIVYFKIRSEICNIMLFVYLVWVYYILLRSRQDVLFMMLQTEQDCYHYRIWLTLVTEISQPNPIRLN